MSSDLLEVDKVDDIIELDPNYSTTRRLIKIGFNQIAESVNQNKKTNDKSETILFLPEAEGRKGEGGLRKQNYFKKSSDVKPLITIVTVVYNGEEFIEETILSVIKQTYENIEYIVIDGGSTDGTLSIIKKYESEIDYWVSEKDKGIYEAMNKGITLATGEWINFMNGGDRFYSDTILSDVFFEKAYDDYTVLYGNHKLVYPNGRSRLVKAGHMKDYWKSAQFCHQSAFVKTDYHKEMKFSESIPIVADYDFFYKAFSEGRRFFRFDKLVSVFESGGVSDLKRIDSTIGRWKVIDKTIVRFFFYCYLVMKESLKQKVKSFVKP